MFVLLVADPALQAQNLNPTETKILQAIEAEKQQPVDLLRQLVEINSGTKNLEGVRAVGKVLKSQFESLGFKVGWVPMDEVQRAGTLMAEHPCPDPGCQEERCRAGV